MFDRYTVGFNSDTIQQTLGKQVIEPFSATFNAAPSQRLPVVTNVDSNSVQLFYWGLSSKLSNNKSISKKLINLPSDSALGRPVYRKILSSNRCWILTNGLYVWKQVSKKAQTPYYFHKSDRSLVIVAGIWEEFEEFDGSISHSFNMITVPAQDPLIGYSDDAPAVLDEQQAQKWLSKELEIEQIQDIFDQIDTSGLTYYPVSPLINNLELTGESLIQPTQPSDQHGNYTLF